MNESLQVLIDLLKEKIAAEDWDWCAQYREELEKLLADLGFRFVTGQEIDTPANPEGCWWACLENVEGQQFFGFSDEPNLLDPSSDLIPPQVFLAVYRAAIAALESLLEATR